MAWILSTKYLSDTQIRGFDTYKVSSTNRFKYTRKSGIIYCCTFIVEPSFLVQQVILENRASFIAVLLSWGEKKKKEKNTRGIGTVQVKVRGINSKFWLAL